MSIGSYHDILKRALEELNREERQRLIEELSNGTQRTDEPIAGGRSLYDALEERGMIGFMRDAPPDFSTNPKYMEGFGQDAE